MFNLRNFELFMYNYKGPALGSDEWSSLLLSACQRIVSRNLYPSVSLIRSEKISGGDTLIRATRDGHIASGRLVITDAARASTRGTRTGPKTLKMSNVKSSTLPETQPSKLAAIRLCPTRTPKTDVHRERKPRYENLVSDHAVRDYYSAAARIRETTKR